MILMKLRILPLTAAAALALAACSSPAPTDDQTPTDTGRLSVVAGLYPYAYLAEAVGGDLVTVTNLTAPGAEPHDLELTAQQVASVGTADLVVYEAAIQPAVAEAVEQASPRHVLEVTTAVPLVTFSETGDHDHEADDATDSPTGQTSDDPATEDDHDHGAEEDHDHATDDASGTATPADPSDTGAVEHEDEDDTHAGHSHDATGPDPHIWLDPSKMISLAEAIAEELSRIDPDHADDYDANLAQLRTTLDDLDQAFETGLAQCRRTAFITTHAAFNYLADRYHLEMVPIAGLSPDSEPSPARIAEIQRIATAEGVTTIFFETLASPALAQSIADDLGLSTDILDPIEGVTDQSRGTDYPSIMTENLNALRAANDCA